MAFFNFFIIKLSKVIKLHIFCKFSFAYFLVVQAYTFIVLHRNIWDSRDIFRVLKSFMSFYHDNNKV